MRGMAVEDEYGAGRQQFHSPQSMPGQGLNPQMHLPHTLQAPRTPYTNYPQADYSQYYNGPGREPYTEYQYGHDAYRGTSDPSLFSSPSGMSGTSPNMYLNLSPAELHRPQPGIFFDYVAAARPPISQFYYPGHQAIIYPPPSHSPMLTPQLIDKKWEFQVCLSSQLSGEVLTNAISTISRSRLLPST